MNFKEFFKESMEKNPKQIYSAYFASVKKTRFFKQLVSEAKKLGFDGFKEELDVRESDSPKMIIYCDYTDPNTQIKKKGIVYITFELYFLSGNEIVLRPIMSVDTTLINAGLDNTSTSGRAKSIDEMEPIQNFEKMVKNNGKRFMGDFIEILKLTKSTAAKLTVR